MPAWVSSICPPNSSLLPHSLPYPLLPWPFKTSISSKGPNIPENHHKSQHSRFLGLAAPPPTSATNSPKYLSELSPNTSILSRVQQQHSHGNQSQLVLYLGRGKAGSQLVQDLVQNLKALPTSQRLEILTSTIENDGGFRTVSVFNNLLAVLIAADEFELALKLSSNLSSYGLAPDYWTYSVLVTCYCKKDDPFEAKSVLGHMLRMGLHPDVATFTTLINSFCKKGRIHKAYDVFGIMDRIGCEPTINTYNCLLKGLCYVGKVEEAYDLLTKKLKKSSQKPDIYTYTAVMNGLCKVGRSDEASDLLDEAVKMGLTPSAVTYNTLFNGYFKEGRPLDGIFLLKRMKEGRCSPDSVSYSTLLHGLLKWGKIRAALRVYEEMVEIGFGVDDRLMNTLLRGLCRQARHEKRCLKDVYELFEKMKSADCDICPRAHSMVIEAFCSGKEVRKALATLREMIRVGTAPRSIIFNNVIRALCDDGKLDEALSLLDYLMQSDHRLPLSFSFDILIDELSQHGMLIGACSVYGVALKRGVVPRRKPKSS